MMLVCLSSYTVHHFSLHLIKTVPEWKASSNEKQQFVSICAKS